MRSQRIASYDQSQLKDKDGQAGCQKLALMKEPLTAVLMSRQMLYRIPGAE